MRRPSLMGVAIIVVIAGLFWTSCQENCVTRSERPEESRLPALNPGGLHNGAIRHALHQVQPEAALTEYLCRHTGWNVKEIETAVYNRSTAQTVEQGTAQIQELGRAGGIDGFAASGLSDLLTALYINDQQSAAGCLATLHDGQYHGFLFPVILSIGDSSVALGHEFEIYERRGLDFDWGGYAFDDIVGATFGGLVGGVVGAVAGGAGCSLMNAYHQFY